MTGSEFKSISHEKSMKSLEHGKKIYLTMKMMYPENNAEDLDYILNSICAALFVLMKQEVKKPMYNEFVRLINQIIQHNLEEENLNT